MKAKGKRNAKQKKKGKTEAERKRYELIKADPLEKNKKIKYAFRGEASET